MSLVVLLSLCVCAVCCKFVLLSLAMNIDTHRRSFYAYVRSRCKARTAIGPLVDNQDGICSLPQDLQVQEFDNYFASVFTNHYGAIFPEWEDEDEDGKPG